ncbi:hypothetical protein QA601_01860 [Chitinispirillales bacterium ANBcel5]|uniref:hypothetical protein n=1 Tax=Cellulosispirillum alkaliphilum TaxID=3039283 RepID=UPI002A52B06E|nr:hypothetical protein [Chitinispirillales bacterium ANBcel5]
MFWTIVLWIFAFIFLVVLILLFSSLRMQAKISFVDNTFAGRIKLRWIHAFILSLEYDSFSAALKGRLFGRKIQTGGGGEEDEWQDVVSEEVAVEEEQEAEETFEVEEMPVAEPAEEKVTEEEPVYKKDTEKKDRFGGLKKLKGTLYANLFLNLRWRQKVIRCVFSVIKKMLSIIKFNLFNLRVKAGLQDPSEMGRLYGYVTALKSTLGLNRSRRYVLNFEPVFMTYHLDFDFEMKSKTSLWRILLPFLTGLIRFPYLRTFILWRRWKKEQKSRGTTKAAESKL